MNKTVYAHAGFWIRLLARLVDFTLIAIISNLVLFLSISKDSGAWQFKTSYLFYIYAISTSLLVLVIFVLIPILTKGWSIGYKVCKIKVITTNTSLTKTILNREALYGISWALIIILTTIFVNNSLIFKISNRSTTTNVTLTKWEQLRLSVVATISSVLFFIQAFVAITIIPNKEKLGFHDRASNSVVIRTNKKSLQIQTQKKEQKIVPTKIVNQPIEWIKGTYE